VPQVLLPVIPDGATSVNDCLSIVREDGLWTYFYGLHPVFAHEERDRRSFRMYTAQLVMRGMCQQVEVVRTFGVSKNSVKRSVKKYREEGIETFYRARRGQDLVDVRRNVAEQVGNAHAVAYKPSSFHKFRPVVYRWESVVYREFYNMDSLRTDYGASQREECVSKPLARVSKCRFNIFGTYDVQVLKLVHSRHR
jgi:biotin operon repressor